MSRVNHKLFGCFFILSLTSCASIPVEQVDSRIGAWNGVQIEQLIQFWGLPSNQRQVGQKYYAEWLNRNSEPGNTAVSIGTGSRGRHSSIGIGLTLFELGGSDDACSRLVTYNDEGLVSEISWQGTRDYCFQITPDRALVEANTAQKTQID